MLDVITDFWKPVKKPGTQGKPDLSRLQSGSNLTFGYVPQANLSGRRMKVSAINTYQLFGEERITSFVLAQEGEEAVSMIIATDEGESWLTIARRIPFAERMRMFDPAELETAIEQPEAVKLSVRDIDVHWKHWLVGSYKKEIFDIKGSVIRGDFRHAQPPAAGPEQVFDYFLFTSENNEYGIEVERYADGRLEMYAMIYRRVGDVVETEHPLESGAPSTVPTLEIVKPETFKTEEPSAAAPVSPAPRQEEAPPPPLKEETRDAAPGSEPVTAEMKAAPEAPVPPTPISATGAIPPKAVAQPIPYPRAAPAAMPVFTPAPPVTPPPSMPSQPSTPIMEKKTMQFPASAAANGATTDYKEKPLARSQDIENDAVECDLRIANKIIEEAIRNEMRLSDVVRRIIALPVANPEAVQIPVVLAESDFQLLAIRYGLPAGDKAAIKARIIDELGDFGGKKQ